MESPEETILEGVQSTTSWRFGLLRVLQKFVTLIALTLLFLLLMNNTQFQKFRLQCLNRMQLPYEALTQNLDKEKRHNELQLNFMCTRVEKSEPP